MSAAMSLQPLDDFMVELRDEQHRSEEILEIVAQLAENGLVVIEYEIAFKIDFLDRTEILQPILPSTLLNRAVDKIHREIGHACNNRRHQHRP